MKTLYLFFLLSIITGNIHSQTLFTYGNNAVTKNEFLRAYNKNKTAANDKAVALREYLDLYIKFKLKVQAAKELRIDTLASLASELQNFRTQVEENYLNDESKVNALIKEAFERSRKDIHVAYLFYPAKDYADSIAVEKKHASSKEIWTDIGFVTVFNIPYQFENIIYKQNTGEESKPVSTKTGYYIFKNIAERKAAGKIKAAQILIALPEGANEQDKSYAKKLVDSIYNLLQSGADFGELAKQYSNDKITYLSGGIMPEFGIGKYDPVFENNVFLLQKDGDITPPFETKFGYHIVKRISNTGIPAENNDSYLYTLKQQVLQDSRITAAKEKFLNDVLKKLSYKINPAIKENDLFRFTDSLVISNKKIVIPGLIGNTILFSLNNQSIKVNDWITWVKNYKTQDNYKGETNKELMNKYVQNIALENYRKKLPDFNPEFKNQLQEFKDGNMLFEIMERNVWTKASNDTKGLKDYYTLHKTKYTWNESADAILISCANDKSAQAAEEQIKNGKSWQHVAEENSAQIQTDSGRYELTQLPVKPNIKFTDGMVTSPLVNENDGTATFVKIVKLYPANQQRSFEEARGLVINDYQNYLEEKWIEQLKKKYPVKVNEKVFQSLL